MQFVISGGSAHRQKQALPPLLNLAAQSSFHRTGGALVVLLLFVLFGFVQKPSDHEVCSSRNVLAGHLLGCLAIALGNHIELSLMLIPNIATRPKSME